MLLVLVTRGEITHPSLRRQVLSSNPLSVSDSTLKQGQQGNRIFSISESGLDLTKASSYPCRLQYWPYGSRQHEQSSCQR